jgi:hypothetical protein
MNNTTHFMPELKLPGFGMRLENHGGKWKIYDSARRKWVMLTPEEWVRQHIYHYLISMKNYPRGLTQCEVKVVVNGLNRRFDLMVSDVHAKPLLLVECKAPDVKISQKTFYQIASYASVLRPKLIMVSNGIEHFVCKISPDLAPQFLVELPDFKDIDFI